MDLDSSTRSTDHMLGGEDEDFSLQGIGLQSLGSRKEGQEGRGNKHTKSRFDHLMPKKHQMSKYQHTSVGLSDSMSVSEHEPIATSTVDATIGQPRYLLWEGRNKFLCGGRLMMGVHTKHLVLTTTLLLMTNVLFLFLIVPLIDLPYLFEASVGVACITLLFLFLTAFTEPGIIPRRPPSKLFESMSQDAREKMQYCHTCRIVRPPRAKHCRYCDNCVEVFDHHCPWTGTCIGVRNYRYFFIFVIFTTMSAAICCASSIYLIVRWAEGLDKRVGILLYVRDVAAPLLTTWTLMVFCLVGALLVFHLFLMGRHQTTNEFLRGVRPVHRNRTSCWSAVFGRTPPSKLLPMHECRTAEDDEVDNNAVAHAINSLRSQVEEQDV